MVTPGSRSSSNINAAIVSFWIVLSTAATVHWFVPCGRRLSLSSLMICLNAFSSSFNRFASASSAVNTFRFLPRVSFFTVVPSTICAATAKAFNNPPCSTLPFPSPLAPLSLSLSLSLAPFFFFFALPSLSTIVPAAAPAPAAAASAVSSAPELCSSTCSSSELVGLSERG